MNKDLLTISQEAVELGKNQDLNGFVKLFSDLGNNFRSVFTNLFQEKTESISPIDAVANALSEFRSDSEHEVYQQVRNMNALVPPGFKGRFSNYALTLQEATDLAGNLEDIYFVPTKRFLAELLATPEKMRSVTLPLQDLKGGLIDEKLEKTSAFFKGTIRTDQARFGDVYANLKDLDLTADRLIMAHRQLNKLSVENVRQHAQEIASLVDKIIVRMKQKPEAYSLNGINANHLATMIHTAARASEFYGTIYNELRIATYAYVDTLN